MNRLWEEQGRLLETLVEVTRRPLVMGSLITKYKRCNKGGCRCTRGEPHGPFWYVSQSVGGRTVMQFIRAAEVARVRGACERARQWRRQRAQVVRRQARLLRLLDQLAARATVPLEAVTHRR